MTVEERITRIMTAQREFFKSGATNDCDLRIIELQKLQQMIKIHRSEICEALYIDLHKSANESMMTEIGLVLSEIKYHIQHLKRWSKPQRVSSSFFSMQGKSYIRYEPFGQVLIIAPWNYPFLLLLSPLIGAISSGNCVVLKTSPQSTNTSALLTRLFSEYFQESHIALFEGHSPVNKLLLAQNFNYIFFTGGPGFGKYVAQCAAEKLIPYTLELGGKSPCIVSKDADLELAARRIIWGKFLNAGQTCIAPDYLLVDTSIKNKLIEKLKKYIVSFFGEEPSKSETYPRIISDEATNRLIALLNNNHIVYGGEYSRTEKYIAPTIVDNPNIETPLMQEEIFGPILPVIATSNLEQAIRFINKRPKPLALYFFGCSSDGEKVAKATSSGGMCINDTILQITNPHLPFGGVGASGSGRYHGFESFRTFSNPRGIYKAFKYIDLKFRYPPYKLPQIFKRFL